MGEKVFWFEDCPECGSKDSFENFEHLSSLVKAADCDKCGYTKIWDVTDRGNVINIRERE